MGLMQLLTVGRSLGRISDEPSRYKMTQQTLLPKFGSVNAPEERVRGLSEKTNPVGLRAGVEKTKPKIETTINDRKNMNLVQPSSQGTAAPKASVSPRPAFPRGRWTLFKNPFSKTPKPTTSPAPVQSELLLDAVKPIRNDLSDADLELVQAVQPIVEKSAPEVVHAPESESADGVVWNRIKNQFFGAGKA